MNVRNCIINNKNHQPKFTAGILLFIWCKLEGYSIIVKIFIDQMKRILILALILIPMIGKPQNPDSTWIVNNYHKIERTIPMRDGVKLFTSIYIPNDLSEDHPVLMTRTPYSCEPYGEKLWKNFWNSYQKSYFKENYIIHSS